MMTDAIDLDRLVLERGSHPARDEGVCLMEAVSWWAGEEHSDRPACVSPVLAAYGRHLNDALHDADRQLLVPLVPLLVGTVDEDADQADGLRCAHWLVAVCLPQWLDLVPELQPHAAGLRAMPAPGNWDEVQSSWTPLLETLAAGGNRFCARREIVLGSGLWAPIVAVWVATGMAGFRDSATRSVMDAAMKAANQAQEARQLEPVGVGLRHQTINLYIDLVTQRRGEVPA